MIKSTKYRSRELDASLDFQTEKIRLDWYDDVANLMAIWNGCNAADVFHSWAFLNSRTTDRSSFIVTCGDTQYQVPGYNFASISFLHSRETPDSSY